MTCFHQARLFQRLQMLHPHWAEMVQVKAFAGDCPMLDQVLRDQAEVALVLVSETLSALDTFCVSACTWSCHLLVMKSCKVQRRGQTRFTTLVR
jgi:hypothetical protein